MWNLYLCMGALVLFTIGFSLVRMGNPFKQGGGDSYTKRRMRRMLGWMMWTTAAVMVFLSLASELSINQLPESSDSRYSVRPEIAHVAMETTSTRIIPNLLHSPPLEANTPAASAASATADTGSLNLSSIQGHQETIMPSLIHSTVTEAQVVSPTVQSLPQVPDATSTPTPGATDLSTQPPAPAAVMGPVDPAKRQQLDTELAAADASFTQKRYDAARVAFIALVNDADFGDLAKYKVFLCDLYGGHENVAAQELAVFNQVGSEASYYFANVAWSLYHKNSDDAKNWWNSANSIFAPDKINLYAKPLIELGYIKVTS